MYIVDQIADRLTHPNKTVWVTKNPSQAYYTEDLIARGPLSEI